jgi:hypothetical protein
LSTWPPPSSAPRAAIDARDWPLRLVAGLITTSGLTLIAAPFQPYQVDIGGLGTSGFDYTSGADDASTYGGPLTFIFGVMLSVLGLIALRWARQGLAVAVIILGALSLAVAGADTSSARHENDVGGGSLGRGLVLNLGASTAAVLLGVAMIVLIRNGRAESSTEHQDEPDAGESTGLADAARSGASLPPPSFHVSEPPSWRPDPSRRHDLRYWDGSQWTEHVSSDGVQSTDPIDDPG